MRLTLRLVNAPEGTDRSAALLGFDARGGTIGRSPTNSHVIKDPTNRISSQHASIDMDAGKFFLTDLSRNGVVVNEDARPVGRGNRRLIADGDRIEFGPLLYAAAITGVSTVADNAVQSPLRRDPLEGFSAATATPAGNGMGLGGLFGGKMSEPAVNADPLPGLLPMSSAPVYQPLMGAPDRGISSDVISDRFAAPPNPMRSPTAEWNDLLPVGPPANGSKPPVPDMMGNPHIDGLDDFLAGIAASEKPAPAAAGRHASLQSPPPLPTAAINVQQVAPTPALDLDIGVDGAPRSDGGSTRGAWPAARTGTAVLGTVAARPSALPPPMTVSDADVEFGLTAQSAGLHQPFPQAAATASPIDALPFPSQGPRPAPAGGSDRMHDSLLDLPTRVASNVGPLVQTGNVTPPSPLDGLASAASRDRRAKVQPAPAEHETAQQRAPLPPTLLPFVIELGRDVLPIATSAANDPVESLRRRAQERMALRHTADASDSPIASPSRVVAGAFVVSEPPIWAELRQAAPPPAFSPSAITDSDPSADRAKLNALWTAMGIDPASVDEQDEADLLAEIGRFVRVSAQGMVQILALRRSVKDELRMDQTVIRQNDNNPFKFYQSGDEVLADAVGHRNRGFMPLPVAAEQGLDNLREHNMVTMLALQSAISVVMSRFDPALIEAATKKRGIFFRRLDHRRLWSRFVTFFREFDRDMDRNARSVLEEAFSAAKKRIGGVK